MRKSDVRICNVCGNIRDVGAAEKYDSEFVVLQLAGKDDYGKFITRLGVWKSYVL